MGTMWRVHRLLRRRVLIIAVKAALASGVAYYLGSLLPEPLDGYSYYAALGAFTVVGLVLVDSVKESVQVFGAVALGVAIAVGVEALTFANPVTVAVTIAVGVLLGSARLFGAQRTWTPIAALFVLATGGPEPGAMALGYVVQIPLGAVVGVLVNVLFFAPLGDDDLEPAAAYVQRRLAVHMRTYAEILREQNGDGAASGTAERDARAPEDPTAEEEETEAAARRGDVVHDTIVELEQAQARLRSAIIEARRAMRGNPRIRLRRNRSTRQLDRAEALSRCAATLMAVGVVLGQSAPALHEEGIDLCRRSATALDQAADVFAHPDAAREEPEMVRRSRESLESVLEHSRAMPSQDGLDDVLFGALALAIRECLRTFTREVAEIVVTEADGGA